MGPRGNGPYGKEVRRIRDESEFSSFLFTLFHIFCEDRRGGDSSEGTLLGIPDLTSGTRKDIPVGMADVNFRQPVISGWFFSRKSCFWYTINRHDGGLRASLVSIYGEDRHTGCVPVSHLQSV